MKQSKRLLALLLSLVLAFGLALPVFAEGEAEEPDPAMPVIAVHPKNANIREFLFIRTEVTLSVQAYIPNGDAVGYQWYRDGVSLTGETNSTLTCKNGKDTGWHYVEVYNKTDPAYAVKSLSARVAVESLLPRAIQNPITEALKFLVSLPLLPIAFLFESLFGAVFLGSLFSFGLYDLIASLFR